VFSTTSSAVNVPSGAVVASAVTVDAFLAQVELGNVGSSYISTVAATSSRSADILSITGANFSGFWNASEGTIKIVGIQDGKPTGKFISINVYTRIRISTLT